ncbi:MAG: SDR family oxidoreductase, partial [Methylophilaceae bacterium]
MQTPRILVTGATGFVGHELCRRLLDKGMHVRAAIRGRPVLSEMLSPAVEQFEVGNIDHATNWSKALAAVDVVVHLAARVHVMHDHAADPLAEFQKVNLHATVNLAMQAASAGVKRFVYVSSIKVNGECTTSGLAFKESDSVQPQDPYAISKWEAEQELQTIARNAGIEVVIVRPPLVYGPGVKANFARLLNLVDRGIPLPLGSVRNSRSLVYVGNLVDALIACAVHPAAAGQTYLVSDGEDVSTPQLIRAVATALNRPSRVFPVPIALMRGTAKLIGKSAAVDRLTQSLVIDSSKICNEL